MRKIPTDKLSMFSFFWFLFWLQYVCAPAFSLNDNQQIDLQFSSIQQLNAELQSEITFSPTNITELYGKFTHSTVVDDTIDISNFTAVNGYTFQLGLSNFKAFVADRFMLLRPVSYTHLTLPTN